MFLNKILIVGQISFATVSWNRKVKFTTVAIVATTIVIKKGKIVWKHGSYCWCFPLNLKYLGWPYRAYIKTGKNDDFCEEFLSENNIEAVLTNLCCYDHCSKASETVQKIVKDLKEYHKCSPCVIICWIAKIYLAINHSSNSEKWLVTIIHSTLLKKLLKLHRKKKQ